MKYSAGSFHRPKQAITAAAALLWSIAMPLSFGPATVSAREPSRATPSNDTASATTPWTLPDDAAVRDALFALLDARRADRSMRRAAEAILAPASTDRQPPDLLDRVAQTVALVDTQTRELVAWCRSGSATELPDTGWILKNDLPAPIAASLRLYAARAMVHRQLYDEAARLLSGLTAGDVFDPPSLLFYQAVVYHQLVQRKEALQAADQLLAGGENVPRRFVAVARLIQADLQSLEKDSLDHIARQMDNSGRYLDLGRADDRVQKLQQQIVDALDKLIEQLEKAQKQQAAASAGSMQPQRPAEESRLLGGRGAGEVTKRPIGNQSGWGNLPPKQREEALQQISRRFPAHYREVIEQYFRRLASEEMP